MSHILPTLTNETISKENGDYYPVSYNVFAGKKHDKKLYGTQTRRDDLLFMCMIDPLFSLFLSMFGSRRIYVLRNFK